MVFNTKHLGPDHWNNLDARHRNWSEYNSSTDKIRQREKLNEAIITIIKVEIFPQLTYRQIQIVKLYFEFQLHQAQIATILGISQPTVSQHLSGKRRNGRKIGGLINKIRKTILKNSHNPNLSASSSEYMVVFQKLLDERTSSRRKTSLYKKLKL